MTMNIWWVVMIVATLEWCSATILLPLHRASSPNHAVGIEKLIARDQLRRNSGIAAFGVSGRGDDLVGLYYTTITVGSPSTDFKVLIDSGSDLSWISCTSCVDCPRLNRAGDKLNLYDVATSSTGEELPLSHPWCDKETGQSNRQCSYSTAYPDGSNTSGYFVRDLLQLNPITKSPSLSSTPFEFGCSSNLSGFTAFPDYGIAGVLGLSPGARSMTSQLSSQGFIPRVYSQCLQGDSNGSGKLVLGKVVHPNMSYTRLIPSNTHYQVSLEKIVVNGQPLPIDPTIFSKKGTIVDSGTSMTYLIAEAYDPLLKYINSFVSEHVDIDSEFGMVCYRVKDRELELFPTLSLHFAGGSSMDLKPKDYLLKQPGNPPKWCLGFLKSHKGYGFATLGAIVFRDKLVVYDLYQEQFGWVDYDCSSSSYPVDDSYGFDDKGGERKLLKKFPTFLTFLIPVLIVAAIIIVSLVVFLCSRSR